MQQRSVCGVICATDCRAYLEECEGCVKLQGKVSWAEYYNDTYCPIYRCVMSRQLSSCADCGLAPCDVWYDTRNPAASDDEFERDINSRLDNLRM